MKGLTEMKKLLVLMLVLVLCFATFATPSSLAYGNTLYPGSIVRFGAFEQDNYLQNGPEPIEWTVLYADSQKVLLISRYALTNMSFNRAYTHINWEQSTIRSWLNNNFYYNAFNASEKNAILTNGSSFNSWSGSYGSINTSDNVFLLSLDELNYYFDNPMSRRVMPTPYARAQGIDVTDGFSWWWLRTNGDSNLIAQFVFENGYISVIGRDVSSSFGGVRPAIWVSASAL